VLLVIALIAVAGTMFLVSVESLGRSSPADEFEGAFWRAMAQGRERALATRRTVELRWDEDTQAFMLASAGGETAVRIEGEAVAKNCSATFSEEVAANDFILVRGALITRRPARAVRLFPDGTCQPFAIEFELGAYKHRITIDPWTGAEMLSPESTQKGGRS
jgi:general secretion pathway protein H